MISTRFKHGSCLGAPYQRALAVEFDVVYPSEARACDIGKVTGNHGNGILKQK